MRCLVPPEHQRHGVALHERAEGVEIGFLSIGTWAKQAPSRGVQSFFFFFFFFFFKSFVCLYW